MNKLFKSRDPDLEVLPPRQPFLWILQLKEVEEFLLKFLICDFRMIGDVVEVFA